MARSDERPARNLRAEPLHGLLVALALVFAGLPAAAEDASLDDELAELGEALGALQHLRPLCGAEDGPAWREQMNAVLDTVQPTREKRLQIVDRFNQSYRSLAAVHHECTPATRMLAEKWRRRGEELGREIVSRWGHP